MPIELGFKDMTAYILTEESFWSKKIELALHAVPKLSSKNILLNILNIESTLEILEKEIDFDALDENTFFIAQGIACQALMRFLSLHFKKIKNKRMGGIIFLEAWLAIETENVVLQEWNQTPIDYQTVFRIIPFRKFQVFLKSTENADEIRTIWEQRLEAEVSFTENINDFVRLTAEKMLQWIKK